ncbi:hypothetical protein BT96DRAFT_936697 [Gymnopus androsaceus JB14]|uniref:CCHC-type domain-containing protein n=1 Tax=Gymnopus androsaceus JB14 TaxID=1447944 RepID=A0A6A4HYS9_9AGAR|nr:hypothetical protein BT96DRAFT_936697 [Gymnopus androsaceus JB14]
MATNPLAKLPLKGSGKGPKFPEYVTGQGVKDFIDDVEELVSDVPEITSESHKKEALIRYLSSEVKRTWKAIEGYDETASIKKLDEVLKSYRHLRVGDLDRILDLKRELGPLKKGLLPNNKLSNREFVQKILKTLDEEFCAEVWSELARNARQKAMEQARAAIANPNAIAAVNPQGHTPSEDDPIGLDELLDELELQARVHDSETSVMGMHIVNKFNKSAKISNSTEVKVKQEQRDNDMAQLRDVLVNQQRDYDRRHKELLDVVVKLAQEVKVAPAYQQRTYNNTPSTYQPQPHASGPSKGSKDVESVLRDILCWFCGEQGHLSGRCLVRQKYLDEGKIILKGLKVCLPNGQAIYYSTGGDCQKLQVDKQSRDTQQTNMFGDVFSEEDLAATPIEEVQAYLEALKERKRVTVMIQKMRSMSYDEDLDEGNDFQSANIQTRQQAKKASDESDF